MTAEFENGSTSQYTREEVVHYLYYVFFAHLTVKATCKYCKQVIGKLKDMVAACKHFHD